jgi:GPH family glycoside/pentoside/hexuronide:cation symporter
MSAQRVPLVTKIIYGSGDFGLASFGILRQIFYAIFLTDVVGLDPRLGSFGALAGIVWDAINDPLIGYLSDHLRSRWGRRRPFLLFGAIPFGLAFVLLWTAPQLDSEVGTLLYVTLAFMLADTVFTLVSVPYYSLTPELTRDYDERTSITAIRIFFELTASLVVAIAAPAIVDAAQAAGATQQQGYLIVSGLFGALAAVPFLVIFFAVREESPVDDTPATLRQHGALRTAWMNIPFRFAAGIHLFNWLAVNLTALIAPYYLLYWIAEGDMLAKVPVFGAGLAYESAALGLLLVISIIFIPFWYRLARRTSKRQAYLASVVTWIVVQLFGWFIPSGGLAQMLTLTLFLGVCISSAYVLPDALFPDVLEWDELLSHRRREGIYYGARSLILKLSSALVFFFVLQLLGWVGYAAPPAEATSFMQSPQVLTAIRAIMCFATVLCLCGAALSAWFFPINRERHARMRRLLAARREKAAQRV